MPMTKLNVQLAFAAWLATLSLDAAHTDLCPNLAYIPLAQLRRLHAEGCAPTAEAMVDHHWQPRTKKRSRPKPRSFVNDEARAADQRRVPPAGADVGLPEAQL